MINKTSGLSVYKQIEAEIIKNIQSGKWNENNKLPSEDSLTKYFKVSRGTVRQAIGNLVNQGILERIHGSGTFIVDSGFEFKISSDNFISFLEKMEENEQDFSTKIIEKGLISPSSYLIEHFEESSEIYFIKRVRKFGNIPIMVSIDHLPCDTYENIENVYDDNVGIYNF